jgi:hypothetical protein
LLLASGHPRSRVGLNEMPGMASWAYARLRGGSISEGAVATSN